MAVICNAISKEVLQVPQLIALEPGLFPSSAIALIFSIWRGLHSMGYSMLEGTSVLVLVMSTSALATVQRLLRFIKTGLLERRKLLSDDTTTAVCDNGGLVHAQAGLVDPVFALSVYSSSQQKK